MQFHYSISGFKFIAAGFGSFFYDCQFHIGEHPLEVFSIMDAAALPIDDYLQLFVGVIIECGFYQLTGGGEEDVGFIFDVSYEPVVMGDIEAAALKVQQFYVICSEIIGEDG